MKYMTVGTFAKICGTRKANLHFYDKEGLLKPCFVSKNGYRYYNIKQIYEFSMITMLKDTGSSLKEIKDYQMNRDVEAFLPILEEKQKILEQERIKLAKKEKRLETIIELVKESLQTTFDTIEFKMMDEERLEALNGSLGYQCTEEEEAKLYAQHIDYYGRQNGEQFVQLCALIPTGTVLQNEPAIKFFLARAEDTTPAQLLHIRPKGLYAVLFHKGLSKSHNSAICKMINDLHQSGLSTLGDIYSYDMIGLLTVQKNGEYAAKYIVRIETAR